MDEPRWSLLNFQEDWVKLVDKGFAAYGSLTSDERIWFNLQSLVSAIYDGGFFSFYYNSYADRTMETIEDLQTFGFNEVAKVLQTMNGWFPGGRPSNDIEERNRAINAWPEGKYAPVVSVFDKAFRVQGRELERKLVEHILARGLAQPRPRPERLSRREQKE